METHNRKRGERRKQKVGGFPVHFTENANE